MWATHYIEHLQNGETVRFRPHGESMTGRIDSGQLVTVEPIKDPPLKGDIVLCKVNGRQYLHLVKAVGSDGRFQIGNNKGHINGWCSLGSIYGIVTNVED